MYHGAERNRSRSFLAEQDVIITTYQTLAGELGCRSGLMHVPWLRVVLDEGHQCKNAVR